ncbi:SCO family protein [Salinarimonas rosea]|uniref:SCO family protein n=1 Tax=Salinarimonas rosea TaxID=552063 RepID=UPI00042A0498|nr:SCO family protein [Salinarimonas rosea]
MTDRTRRLVLPLAAFLFGVVALGIAAVLTLTPQGREVAASDVGGPFTLVDHFGTPVTQADFLGEPHLVFFGFTHCPDVCPTKLFEIAETLDAVEARSGRNLRALFVTVDPERDTPDIMQAYVSSFDDRILGLTGTPEQVDAVVSAYRAFARKVPLDDGDYTMEHTAIVYIMDEEGRFVAGLNTAKAPADAAEELLGRI